MKQIQRDFLPGSEWIYIKLYTGTNTAEKIVINDLYRLTRQLKKSALIEKWFFIRYADPQPHIRFRCLLKNKEKIGEAILLIHSFCNKLFQKKLIHNIQWDIYTRELERYDARLIEDTETLFSIDSESILSVLRKINSFKHEEYRWMISLKRMDDLLNAFGYEIEDKQKLLTWSAESFKHEFGFNEYNSKQLNSKYREHKVTIQQVLNGQLTDKNLIRLVNAMEKNRKPLYAVAHQIRNRATKFKITLNTLLSSYIHMSMNRLFVSRNRIHELVIYEFLRRHYTDQIARQKYNTTQK